MFCRLCGVLGALRFDPALSVPCVRGALFQNGAGVGRYVFCPENTTKDSFKDLAHLPSFGTQMESVAVFQLCSDRALHGYCTIMSMTGSAVLVKKRAAFLYCFDPRQSTSDADFRFPSDENPQLSRIFFYKLWAD